MDGGEVGAVESIVAAEDVGLLLFFNVGACVGLFDGCDVLLADEGATVGATDVDPLVSIGLSKFSSMGSVLLLTIGIGRLVGSSTFRGGGEIISSSLSGNSVLFATSTLLFSPSN